MQIAIDLETMGTSPTAAIVAIGAVEFDVGYDMDAGYYVKLGREFYVNVDLQSCISFGLTVDASTVYWWLNQSDEARAALSDPKRGPKLDLHTALTKLRNWWPTTTDKEVGNGILVIPDGGVRVWARGQDFDIGILRTAFNKVGLSHPWRYNMARDSRTLIESTEFDVNTFPANNSAHDALADAKWEAQAIGFAQNLQARRTFDLLKAIQGAKGVMASAVVGDPGFDLPAGDTIPGEPRQRSLGRPPMEDGEGHAIEVVDPDTCLVHEPYVGPAGETSGDPILGHLVGPYGRVVEDTDSMGSVGPADPAFAAAGLRPAFDTSEFKNPYPPGGGDDDSDE